jgi:hypothetical protein
MITAGDQHRVLTQLLPVQKHSIFHYQGSLQSMCSWPFCLRATATEGVCVSSLESTVAALKEKKGSLWMMDPFAWVTLRQCSG